MAALNVRCTQQHEFAVGKYLKSVKFLEQTDQNSLENYTETLFLLLPSYALCRPLAVEADTLLMPPVAPDANVISTYCPGLSATVLQHSLGRGELAVPWCRWCNS